MESDNNDSMIFNQIGTNYILKHHIASDAVTTDKIEDESITSCKLQDGSVTKDKLSGEIISLLNKIDDLEDNFDNICITTNQIENNSITNEKIKQDSIENENIIDKAITNNKLADNSVNTNNILDNAVTYKKLAKECFHSEHIRNNAIAHEKLADDCVRAINITNECITNEKLTDECIHTVNLLDECVTNKKLTNNCVATQNIMDNSITIKKMSPNNVNTINIINNSITHEKMAKDSVHNENIKSNSITNEKLSSNCIDEYNICDNSITNEKLGKFCVESYNIVDGSITNEKLTEGCIQDGNLIDNSITINKLSEEIIEKINSNILSNNAIETKHLTNDCVTNEKMGINSVTGKNIMDNSVDNTKLCIKSIKTNNICDNNVTREKLSLEILEKINTFDHFIDVFSIENYKNIEIKDNSISHEKLTDGCIENNNLSKECVEHTNLASNCIKSNNIDEGSIINRNLSMHCIKNNNLDIKCIQNENLGLLCIGHENLKIECIDSDNLKKGCISINVLSQDVKNLLNGENNLLNTTSLPVNISHSDSPDINQTLIATSSTTATWQTIDHYNILNVGIYSHIKIDEHIDNTSNVHGIEGNVVGTFDLQTIMNKTLDDRTNIITADNLHSATTTINIIDSTAPILNQTLIATSSNKAIWQTINHFNISNVGINSHIQIDEHIDDISNVHGITGNVVGTIDDQILTNKILDDRTNEITADNLHSSTTTINIIDSPAPTVNQTLMATSSNKAIWKTINHNNIENIGIHDHIQIDEHIENTSNVHGVMSDVVGIDDEQILKNKIINDRSNEITADYLHSATTIINIVDSMAPNTNQTLITTSSDKANWQYIDHINILNIGTHTHEQIDKFIHDMESTLTDQSSAEQILTNKTLNDITNFITCDNLRSVTTIININAAIAPTINQSLTAISSTEANWQTINHNNLSNIGINTHAQIDTHLAAITGIHGVTGNIVGTTDAQTLTNKTFADSIDNTKKMNFVLTPLTTATIVALTIPTLSTTLVGIDSNQILTNKTLNSTTNIITCDNLRSTTTTININAASAPTINQSLIAISSTEANWQTINHNNLSNIGTNTHTQIDTHLGANTGVHGITGNFVGTTDAQTLINKTFADTIDNTKKMIFVLTPLTTATIVALTIPTSSTTLVGIDSSQILTNKILDSTTNIITCDNLRTATTTINIGAAIAPTINQTLIATSSSTATWQTINHANLSNVGIYSHIQIDTHLGATTGVHGITGNFVGTTDAQTLTNKTFADATDFTKKMNFVLTPLATATTVALTIPSSSTTLVGIDSVQILTNKTLNSTTNNITCDALHSATTTININAAMAPTINQSLIATSSTAASWQTINHANLSNVGINSHIQIDTHLGATTGVHGITGNFVGTSDIQTLINKTFADPIDNTKKMNFVLTPLTTATSVALTIPTSSTTLVGIDSIQTLTNKTFADTTDITKKMNFVLTSLTTATTVALTIPTLSTTLVGIDSGQILTNKTLNSTTNIITCDYLRSATTIININTAIAPTVNQSLIATSSTAASWQTINHANLSNVGINSHIQIDTHLGAVTGVHGITGNFVGTSDAQTITNKTIISSNTFADSIDNTKKMNFILTPLTTATTITLTVPSLSTTLVGIDSNQTLTNKTLNSTTNNITCDALHSATTVVDIHTAIAPTVNQSLIATSSSAATWQTINHTNLSNVGINSHIQIDTHLGAITGVHGITGNFVGTSDAQTLTNKTFADATDITKKMNFVLTPLTTATTVALTIPSSSTTLVGIDSVQTLTNKTLNSTTNVITCDNLHSATTTININAATAPTINQALIASSTTVASWQTINHTNLLNIGTNTHAQIDIHLGATTSVHGITGNFVGTSDIQTITNKTFADATDGTKKMNFVLTPLTTATTIALTVPSSSTTLVGIDSIQTLTNKTLNSTTNNITCDNLRSATTIIDINTATAPTVNQSLIATSSTAASWQTINHANLSNIGTNTHAQIDTHLGAITGIHGITGNFVGTTDIQTLTNKTIVSSNTFADLTDGTKKMNFVLTSLATATTIALIVPSSSTTLVGIDSVQTLTNKTLDSTTNNITCDALHSATTTINVELATAPTINQALIAISSSAATWQTINHANILNIGTNTHAQIDTHLSATTGVHGITGSIVGTTDIQILTNKTLDSTTNNITCDALHSATTTINVELATAPTVNQALIATSSSAATWQTINHANLSNVGIYSHIQIDTHLGATTGVHGIIGNFVGTFDTQTLTNKTFADATDGTKKMNFVLTPLITATTVALTIPTASTTLVGIDSIQTLTNKTLNSTTNVITCDNLRSATTIVDIHSTIAPTVNQSLIATSSTAACWQTINHTNLSNIGTNTHAQIDTHLGATTGVHGITGNFVGTTDAQTLTNKTIISSNTFADASDNTKKMNFVLTPLTTATTIALTIPVATTTLVGIDSVQTLTNKTLDSTTNTITCDKLRSATTTITIELATAPTANQALIATSSTAASWQTINHTNLSNIGTNTHAQIDSFITSTNASLVTMVTSTGTQTLTNKTIISSNTFADSTDNTKKMNFVLTPLTTATTIALTVPSLSTTLVGIDSAQTLTNKTLDSITNNITCDALRSTTTTINVDLATAPTINQALIATSSMAATWQTISHLNLSNIGTNTHTQIDSFITSTNASLATMVTLNGTQLLTNKTIISSNTFADVTDSTKKMNFVLTPLTTATTVALTIPTASTTLVGINSVQTLTNKTLNSTTNVITCDYLRSATTVIGINTATAPAANQALIASSTTAASWQTIDHTNLSNIGTNTHTQIDSHIDASTNVHGIIGSVVGTSDTQTITNKVFDSSNTFPAGATSTLMNYYVYASTTVTYNTNAYVIINSMTLNPPAGTYYVSFSICVNQNSTSRYALYGFCNTATITPMTNTMTQLITGSTAAYLNITHTAIVTCNGTDGINVVINAASSGALTATIKYRSFSALKIG